MITTRLKNLSLIKILPILSVMVLPLLVIPSQIHQTAYAETSDLNAREAADISSKIIDPAENIEATVAAIVLNIREKPSLSSHVVGKLKMGTKITVHKEQAGWAKIVSSSGVQGWVYEYYLTKDAPSDNQTQLGTAIPPSAELMPNSQEPLLGKTIVLDPGHGGIDNGTTSIVGTPEKTLTLSTAKVVEQKLKNSGANVILTRTNDMYISLQQRADSSNQNHADAFISFHYNWSNDASANGLTDFYYQNSKDNPLALDILNEVAKTTRLNIDGTRFDDLYVLRNNSRPSTLIELGFLSNTQDDSVVESSAYADNVAQGVYLGLLDYFSIKK
ncbi:N-acetylmuramoyl-L-alanine amidase [Neobacillus pocheonensis]|uniref:N-acetylmuramoyl-L-alanine amidase n=1 Tax=Neobacillus pocheonensis TaxID=363869 RepID=A0ABT0WII1_9BACI|nr:N-acetylmuramoyl-L-alanine amidase [Neobacillus pocheonensis]